jgi:DNA-binding beta-propeller fold protein YncE
MKTYLYLTGFFLALSMPGYALQRTETLAVGKAPVHVATDAASGRVFVANAGGPRGEAASITVLERDGRATTLATASAPSQIAVSTRHRRAVALHPGANHASVIDTDTLEVKSAITGINPTRVVIAEATGRAYVISRGAAAGTGSITEIDLRSSLARTYSLGDLTPEGAVVNAAGTSVAVIGTRGDRGAEWAPGYLQVFDAASRSFRGTAVALGRMPRHVLVTAAGDEVYVVGHLDHLRAELAAGDARRQSVTPALFVLDGMTLAVRRTIALPDTRDLDRVGPLFIGRVALDPESGQLYVLDSSNERLLVVNPSTAEVSTVELEAPGLALAVNPVARQVVVSFAGSGVAGIFSMSGERLDTVPTSRASLPGEAAALYHVAVDSQSGDAYVTNGHGASITALRRPTGDAQRVDYTDLWVNPSQPGWGVFLDQQGATLFATLFTHDSGGNPAWMFMSNGTRQPDGSFAGDLHRTRGPLDQALRNVVAVGTMRFEPGPGDEARLIYHVDGGLYTRTVKRFRLEPKAARQCRWAVDAREADAENANFTALWSNPADPGWGLALSHQGEATFGVLFTYDAQNRPTWAVMSKGRKNGPGTFSGDVYRAVKDRIEVAGQMSLAFAGGDHGVLRYRMGGLDFKGPIIRQTFSRLTPRC